MKMVRYGIFCILVLIASILIRRPSDVPQEETTPVESVETSGQVLEAQEPLATTEGPETGAEMMKGQKSSMTTAPDDEDDDDDEDEDIDDDENDDEDSDGEDDEDDEGDEDEDDDIDDDENDDEDSG